MTSGTALLASSMVCADLLRMRAGCALNHLHVTLKFIGEQSEAQVDEIKRALAAIEADHFEMSFRGYGFFPTARAPAVFWVGIEADSNLASLAATVNSRLIAAPHSKRGTRLQRAPHAGSERRRLRFAPSGKGRQANRNFQRLQEKLVALPAPEFGTMTARDFFLYQSQLSPGGSKYTKLAGFSLR